MASQNGQPVGQAGIFQAFYQGIESRHGVKNNLVSLEYVLTRKDVLRCSKLNYSGPESKRQNGPANKTAVIPEGVLDP